MTPSASSPKARFHRLNVRLSQQEWDKIHKLCSNTTCRSTSEYARKVLTEKPVKVFYRNKSFDIFEEQMIRLMSQLDTFGDDFEKAVKILSSAENPYSMSQPMSILLTTGRAFSSTAEKIREHIEKLADQCDQK